MRLLFCPVLAIDNSHLQELPLHTGSHRHHYLCHPSRVTPW